MRATSTNSGLLACTVLASSLALLAPSGAPAYTERSVGTPEQVAWVRSAAQRFLSAELKGDGAGACAILNAPLRATVHRRTCAQRWDARLAVMLRRHGARASLRAQLRATSSARVVVHGDVASIELPAPLIAGPNRFLWTENCWMLTG